MLLSMVSVLLEGLSRAYSCNPAPRRDRGALYGLRNSAGEGGGVGEWGSGGGGDVVKQFSSCTCYNIL